MLENIRVSLNSDEFEEILVYATRYAIGRRTYAVSDVCGIINSHLKTMSTNTLSVIERDISDADDYGMDMDKECWLKTKSKINAELKRRRRNDER